MNLERIRRWMDDYVYDLVVLWTVVCIFVTDAEYLVKYFGVLLVLIAVPRIIIRWKENRKKAKQDTECQTNEKE